MADREKVIKGLECCFDYYEAQCEKCPYQATEEEKKIVDWDCHHDDLQRDALELLKEQEPVAHATWLCEETSTAYDLYGVKTWAAKYKCSKCGSVHRAIEAHMCYSYCPSCGARMDKDAKEGET